MKKFTTLIIAVFALCLFAGTALADAKYIMRIGTTTEPEGHYHKGLLQFKEKVEQYTDGQVQVDIFLSSQLGNERDMIEGLSMGLLEGSLTSSAPLANFSPDFLLLDFPYVVTDREKAYKVMDGPVGQAILGTMDSKGVKAMGFWENGFRHVTNSKRPIVNPEDLKGLKIRTMENPIHQATFEFFGATPTPMAWSEVFLALQQGTIDGQENPLVIIDTVKVYEVQKYISLTGHFYSPAVFMLSKQIFDSYPADIQEAIVKAEKEARDWERAYSAQLDEQLVKDLTAKGVEINTVDAAAWKAACAPIYEKFKDRVNADYLKAMLE
ncbi:C4-dicarboxylate ABC transporter substrate-binding protein [Deltaproteobacteria bacterium Smac51]|nr:C4-dicarboxylate ABC transporter substrate-binding protein [Deltaproteobacteria bacterium Smac51]